ncbi:MAG: hypothetical protein WKG00_18515 [Polyangiaceae bacterium]
MTVAAGAAFALALAGSPGQAQAQDLPEPDAVNGRPKGIIGGALLGGEVVMLTMGAVGVEKGWPYLVFGGLGMVAGGVGGFFIEEAAGPGNEAGDTPEAGVYMLAGGMALVIPTLVVVLNATSYKPPETDTVEPSPTPQPAAEPAAPGASGSVTISSKNDVAPKKAKAATARRWAAPVRLEPVVPHIPMSVVDMYRGELAMGVPAVQIRPMYSHRELALYGVQQGEEVRVPVFKAQF